MVEWLFANGCAHDVCRPCSNGATPLYVACWEGHLNVVHFLALNGAIKDTTNRNYFNVSPLYAACANGHLGIVQWLIKKGGAAADVKVANNYGTTPMLAACTGGHFNIARWLYQNGAAADVRKPNNFGEIPLLHACRQGRFTMVEWLCRRGVAVEDMVRPSNNGITPIELVCTGDYVDIARWVIEQGMVSPIDCPFSRMGQHNKVILHDLGQECYVAFQNFLNLVLHRRFGRCTGPSKNVVGVRHVPMGVLRLIADFSCGTTGTRRLWQKIVGTFGESR